MERVIKVETVGNADVYWLNDGRVLKRIRVQTDIPYGASPVYYYLDDNEISGDEFRELIGEPNNG